MRFHKNLYMDQIAAKNKKKIIRKLKRGVGIPGLYVLVLPLTDSSQLEIYSAALLFQPVLREQNPYIIGFTYGYGTAVELLVELTQEVYDRTGACEIRKYLTAGMS